MFLLPFVLCLPWNNSCPINIWKPQNQFWVFKTSTMGCTRLFIDTAVRTNPGKGCLIRPLSTPSIWELYLTVESSHLNIRFMAYNPGAKISVKGINRLGVSNSVPECLGFDFATLSNCMSHTVQPATLKVSRTAWWAACLPCIATGLPSRVGLTLCLYFFDFWIRRVLKCITSERSPSERLHTVWSQLCDLLEKAKLVSGSWETMGRMNS